MSYDTTKQSVLFENLSKKAVVAKFDQDHASSDGGAVLLKACDEKLELSTTLASCLSDDRQQSKVTHSLEELFRQRLFAIACGYVDGNDAARLADDPVMKLLAGRDPVASGSLASQPTLSRFENAVRARDLLRLSEALAEAVIARHKRRKKRVRRITIDLDPTDDPTHGAQQLAFFNRFYDTGVDPLSWIPNPFGRRNPRCHEHVPHTRLSFATRWWSWFAQVDLLRNWPATSNAVRRPSASGSARPTSTKAAVTTA